MAWFTLGTISLDVLVDQVDLGMPDIVNNRRTITVTIDLDGANQDALGVNLQAIIRELEVAKKAAGSNGYGTPQYVTWEPGSYAVYFDLLPDLNGEVGYLKPGPSSFSHPAFVPQLQLVLSTAAYGRGAAVEILDGLTTYTNGSNSTIFLSGLKGDMPGLIRLTLSDQSIGKVIQDVRVGVRSVPGMTSGDYQGVVTITPEAGASTTDSDSVSTNIAQITAGATAGQLGTFDKPSGVYTDGPLHVFGRVRDHSTVVAEPTGLTAVAGNLLTQNHGEQLQRHRDIARRHDHNANSGPFAHFGGGG